MDEKKPKYLFHYTNINTLALIMKHKKIRLNNLNRVDDLSEASTKDLGRLDYVFASSWTETSEESIPFWKMYTRDMGGVRIKLKSNPFKTYPLPKYIKNEGFYKKNYFRQEWFCDFEYSVLPKWEILQKVNYTNKKELLCPKVMKISKTELTVSYRDIGVYKREEWKFQNEWRYIIHVLPIGYKKVSEVLACNSKSLPQIILDKFMEKSGLPFEDIFLEIDDEAFKELEVTFGPCVNEGDKIIVKSLAEKYCPSAVIKDSVLEGSIGNYERR